MLRITLLSGEELTSLPLTELSDVKGLKQRLHQQHGLPPRFRQRLLHEGNALDDAVKLDSAMDLQVLIVAFSEVSEQQWRELYGAAASGNVAKVETLLQLPMDLDARTDEDGITPLMRASECGHVEIAQLLLEAGAETDIGDSDRCTALMSAAWNGRASVVKLLLDAGAQKDLRDSEGLTALISAARCGHAEAVRLLLLAGAQTCVRDDENRTALMHAAYNGHAAVLRLLLEAGADVPARTALVPTDPEIRGLLEAAATKA
ncbi:Ankyrin repeat domain-containing protein 50 [Symbiodinium microadriaticum]|uniref:Ankyrin repeat domain-containing protein 50 n=1 Tax=Symbiodinium microadriaticum TaxID=2951 RepID=A0A1Q9EUJ2_SYMMI|nr:Ankyrin repeat domain-containing protein 50 [Symbiodinium microadriaticum]